MSWPSTTRMFARGFRRAILLVATVTLLLPTRAAETKALVEYEVKAGYLYNFGKFIEWPTNAFASEASPFVIAVLDGGEAHPVLERILAGKKLNGRPVQVKLVSTAGLPKGAHILLVTRMAGKSPETIQAALGGAATLVVGETEQFAERGGMIGFVLEDDAIRLTLNLERATEAGLKVNAKLSSVAKVVKTMTSR